MPEFATSVRRLPSLPLDLLRSLWRATEALCFWLAVTLPIVYLPLVVLGPGVLVDSTILGVIVVANLLALAIGHGHEPDRLRRVRSD